MSLYSPTRLQVSPYSETYSLSQLFVTSVSIGDANFWRPQVDAKSVVCSISATVPAGTSAAVSLVARDLDGAVVPVEWHEIGGAPFSGGVSLTATGTRTFICKRTTGMDRMSRST